MNYWLIKSEPFKYSFSDLERDGYTSWDGVRNYQARNYMRDMEKDDLALFYHSNEGKEVVGLARVVVPSYADPLDESGTWLVVDFEAVERFAVPVPLSVMRADELLCKMNIFRQMRLSVVSITEEEFEKVCALGRGLV